MDKEGNLITVFTGDEVTVFLLKEALENNGISAITRNDFDAGLTAGFVGGTPSSIDLLIMESDLKKAEPIINQFIEDYDEQS